MPDRIAVKRLSASDLTFFEGLFRKLNKGNQKAINLNADVFIDRLYPSLPDLLPAEGTEIPVRLTIFGPAGAGQHRMSRALTKAGPGYKNWRLNGEFVWNPEGEPERYDTLQPGDLAVIELKGDPGPRSVALLLLSRTSPLDASIHAALDSLIPGSRRTMIQVSRAQVAVAAAGIAASHPIWLFAADPEFDADLEDAIQGGTKGTEKLAVRKGKVVTPELLAGAKATAEKIGREGEALAWVYLSRLKADQVWSEVEWASQINAISPFDFKARHANGSEVLIDAKSTGGDFSNFLHMSLAELRAAASAERYDLWRLYGIDQDGGRLRIAAAIKPIAAAIVGALATPPGVTVDSVSIDPKILNWGPEVVITRPDEPDME